MPLPLTDSEKQILLQRAREAMEYGVTGRTLPILDQNSLPPNLLKHGSSFVTLTIHTELRGCIGSLEAHQSLVDDVREHAIAAALQDPRFPPVQPVELENIHLEISCLTAPQPLEYSSADDLIKKLKPHVDGVILQNGRRRTTFLPQVWAKIPDPEQFLERLCQKMGMDASAWRHIPMQVFVYQAEDFGEES
jgi:AmmeMemoRadiSam system protein A